MSNIFQRIITGLCIVSLVLGSSSAYAFSIKKKLSSAKSKAQGAANSALDKTPKKVHDTVNKADKMAAGVAEGVKEVSDQI